MFYHKNFQIYCPIGNGVWLENFKHGFHFGKKHSKENRRMRVRIKEENYPSNIKKKESVS